MTEQAFQFYTLEAMQAMHEPCWLLEEIIPEDGVGVLYGPSGSGKSFAALSLALSVSEGRPFFDRAAKPGAVLYVCLEGFGQFRFRVQAACEALGIAKPSQFITVRDPLYLHEEDSVERFINAVNAQRNNMPITLTIIDTLTSASAGAEENSNSDRSLQVNAMKRIAAATGGGAVLAIAHTGVNQDRVRGGTALKDLSDFVLKLSDEGAGKILSVEKVKDAEGGQSWPVTLQSTGRSAVLVVADPNDPWRADSLSLNDARDLLRALQTVTDDESGASTSAWGRVSGKPSSSFYRLRKKLMAQGYVAVPKRGRNTVTVKGQEFLSPSPQDTNSRPIQWKSLTPSTPS